MKQKIAVKVHIRCGKCRKEAMKIAASARGVISVTIQGNDKDVIVVIGEDVDSAGLCNALRKKLGHANLMSVEQVKDPKTEEKKPEEKKPDKEEKKPEKEEKKPEEEEKKPKEKNNQEKEAKKPEATIVYHHCPTNCPPNYYPPPNYCYPYPNPPQCYKYTTQYEDHNPNCTIM